MKIVQKEEQGAAIASPVENLQALASEAQAIDSAPGAAQAANAEQEQSDRITSNAGELLQALELARDMLLPFAPEAKREPLRAIWSDAQIKAASAAGAAVMEKHGITMQGMLGEYGCYLALIAAVAPPSVATMRLLKQPELQAAPNE